MEGRHKTVGEHPIWSREIAPAKTIKVGPEDVLTGDEAELLRHEMPLRNTVLKVAHHGSATRRTRCWNVWRAWEFRCCGRSCTVPSR